MNGLAGRRVVNTRALHQAGRLDALLHERGAISLSYPCITLLPVTGNDALDAAFSQLQNNEYDGLILTSANTVEVVAQHLNRLEYRLPPNVTIAAVGPATAQAATERLGLQADIVPDEHIAEALAQSIHASAGQRWLLPQSALASSTLADALRAKGVMVDAVDAYTMGIGSGGVALLPALREGRVDAITLSSGSTVRNLVARLEAEGGSRDDLASVCIACIGPRTAEAAQAMDLNVAVIPATYRIEDMVAALEIHFSGQTTS